MRAAERKFASNKNCLHLILKFELFIFYTIYGHLKSTTNNKYQILDYKMLENENIWETSLQPLRTMPNADAVIGIIIKSGTDMVSLEHEGSKVYRS